MKKNLKILLCAFGLYSGVFSHAQEVFKETFGISLSPNAANNFSRTTSPYMPAGSFTFATPFPASNDSNFNMIDNNHYAVVAPPYIHAGSNPINNDWYFWTKPYNAPIGNYNVDNKPDAKGHTTGDENDAVMVINAGTSLSPFYERNIQMETDSYYKVSFWIYLVKGTSQVGIDVKDIQSGTVLGTTTSRIFYGESWDPLGNTLGQWTEVPLYFTSPSSISNCSSNNVKISLRNNHVETQGNDYYIDDIKVEKINTLPNGITAPIVECPNNNQTCTQPGSTLTGGEPTKIGISSQKNKLAQWPESIPNGFVSLESREKGFVITRVANDAAITDPKEGMLIYSIADACVKLYNGTLWNCIKRSCND